MPAANYPQMFSAHSLNELTAVLGLSIAATVVAMAYRQRRRMRLLERGKILRVRRDPADTGTSFASPLRDLRRVLYRPWYRLGIAPFVTLELLITSAGEELLIHVPAQVPFDVVHRSATRAWPEARVDVVLPSAVGDGHHQWLTTLSTIRHAVFPLQMPLGPAPDLLGGVVHAVRPSSADDTVFYRVTARVAPPWRVRFLLDSVHAFREGKPLSFVSRLFLGSSTASRTAHDHHPAALRAALNKEMCRPFWIVSLSVGVSGPAQDWRERLELRRYGKSVAREVAETFSTPFNQLRRGRGRTTTPLHLASHPFERPMLLCSAELDTLAHLPSATVDPSAPTPPVSPPNLSLVQSSDPEEA